MTCRRGLCVCVILGLVAMAAPAFGEPYYVMPAESSNNTALDVSFSASGYIKLIIFPEDGLLDWLNPKSDAYAAIYANKTVPSSITGTLDADVSGDQLTVSAFGLDLLADGPATVTAGADVHVDSLPDAVQLLLDAFLAQYINQIDPNWIDPNVVWDVVDALTGGFDFQKEFEGTLTELTLTQRGSAATATIDPNGDYEGLGPWADVDAALQFGGGSPIDIPAVPLPLNVSGTYASVPVGSLTMEIDPADGGVETPNVVLVDQVIELPIGEGGINVSFRIHLQIDDGNANYALAPHVSAISGYLLTTNVTPAGRGTVEADPAGPKYAPGAEVELTATETPGWQFSHWQGSVTGSANPVTITMDEHKTVTAVFVKQFFNLTLFVDGSGSVPFVGNATYDPNTGATIGRIDAFSTVTLAPSPAQGWTFDHWEGQVPAEQQSDNPLALLMDQHRTITAVFEKTGTSCGSGVGMPLAVALLACGAVSVVRRRRR
ncbi:MAG: hypothetical protein JXQ73_11585 [Phycisphaerae bacterium]|nr:hypothetical protein [Phycisphaerae bacterium]